MWSAPPFRPVERENPDKTCTLLPDPTFAHHVEQLLAKAEFGGSSVDVETGGDVDDSASVASAVTKPSIPPLHAANIALYNAREELRQACDVMALLSGVPSGVPPDGKLFQVGVGSEISPTVTQVMTVYDISQLVVCLVAWFEEADCRHTLPEPDKRTLHWQTALRQVHGDCLDVHMSIYLFVLSTIVLFQRRCDCAKL
jgi:hypothetical protein